MFLLFAARGSVEDSAAPSSSGRLLHINFNYKSVISENIHSPLPPPPTPLSEGIFFHLNPASIWKLPFVFRLSVKQISLSIFSGNTILFALLPEIRGCKIIFKKYGSCKTF